MCYNSKHQLMIYQGLNLQNKTTIIKREVKGPKKKTIIFRYVSFILVLVNTRSS